MQTKLMQEWNEIILTLSMDRILHILSNSCNETLEYVEMAMNQLIKTGYTETIKCFEYDNLCNILEISIEWTNSLKLCQMIYHI